MNDSAWSGSYDGPVATLTFSRPPLHVISHRDVGDLESLLTRAVEDRVRVVILAGGPDIFIRHADLDDLVAMADGAPTSGDPSSWIRVLRLLDRGRFVTIAAVEGQAWGGGLEIALTCHLRVLGARASLGFPEVALGIIPGVAAHRLIRSVPPHVAMELMALGDPVDAATAERLGLVNRVVADGDALATATDMARRIVRHPAAAVDAVRSLVVDHRDDTERELRRRQSELWAELVRDPDVVAIIHRARARYDAGLDSHPALGVGSADPDDLSEGMVAPWDS